MNRPRAVALVGVAFALIVYCATQLRIGTDITHFMPTGGRSQLAELSAQLADSPVTRTMVVSIGGGDLDRAIAASRRLAAALAVHPEVAWVRATVESAQLADLYQLYFSRRLHFLSEEPDRDVPAMFSEDALRANARSLRKRLSSPVSGLLSDVAAQDPIGAFARIAERFRQAEPSLRVERGQLVSRDGRFAILFVRTQASAFDSGHQAPLIEDLRAEFGTISAELGGGLELELGGANLFAVAAERGLKGDVALVATCSFLGVAALFFVFVGSLRGFLIVSLPPLAGMLVATAAGLAVFGGLDGLTMAFGASLMGIAIDYSNHLLIHHGLADDGEDAWVTVRRIRGSLTLGALTTVASLVGLGVTAFPAFREMSFFAAVGVLAALWVSLYVLPALLGGAPRLPDRARVSAAWLARVPRSLARHRRGLLLVPVAAVAFAATTVPELRWQDDMSRLTRFDPELVKRDRRVRERVSQLETSRFVVGLAGDRASALELNDEIHARLRAAVAAGDLGGMRSLHDLVWSAALQRRNREALAREVRLYERVDAAFAAEGFQAGAFRRFGTALADAPPPLTMGELETSPLSDLVDPFLLPLDDGVAVITYLRGLSSPAAVSARLEGLPGVLLLDQRDFVNEIYREFRATTLRQMLVGGVLVLALLGLRYRAWRPVAAAFLPSVVVALIVMGTLSAVGVRANLLHAMSLIMVLGMGVDYGVFLVDSAQRGEPLGATMLSLLMSCVTTAFVFGTLAFSSQPALQAIGVTTGMGILLSYVLAPVAFAMIAPGRVEASPP